MQKQFLLSVLCCAISAGSANSQATTFQKTYGGNNLDYCYDAHKTYDGGYILGGNTHSYTHAVPRCIVVKTNANGDTLWTVNWGGLVDTFCNQQYINDIVQTTDSGYITCGGKQACDEVFTGGGEITRLDKNGNIVWTKYGTTGFEDPYPVIQDNAGNFVVGGYVSGLGAGGLDACLMKLDPNGDTLWSRTYGGAGDDWFYHILQTKDSGYLAAGFTKSFGQGGEDIYLVKTDYNGNLLWSKTYGTAANDESAFGHSFVATADGGYIVTGAGTSSNTGGPNGIFLMKLDSAGNMGWANYYFGEYGHAVKALPGGGYLITGTTTNPGGLVELIKTDDSGNVAWCKGYGGAVEQQGWILELADDGGYVTGGYTKSFTGSEDMYLVKTDANGNSGCNDTDPVISSSAAPFIQANAATIVMQGINTADYNYVSVTGTTVTGLCFSAGAPDAIISGPVNLCSNQLSGLVYSTSFDSGNTYTWSITGGSITSGAGTDSVVVNWNNSGPYELKVTKCAGIACGLDSIIPVVYSPVTITVYDTICMGDSMAFNGSFIDTAGNYTGHFTSQYGCDSVVNLQLTVKLVPMVSLSWDMLVREGLVAGGSLFDTQWCSNLSPFKLVLAGGTPLGGIYIGNGVSGNVLYADSFHYYYQYDGYQQDTISYTVNLNGCSASVSDTLIVEICSGINQLRLEQSISLYPNPAADMLVVQSALFTTNSVTPVLYDITGKEIATAGYTRQKDEIIFNTRSLSAGMYFIKLNINGSMAVKKFVKVE